MLVLKLRVALQRWVEKFDTYVLFAFAEEFTSNEADA